MFVLCISMFCILTPLPASMEQNHRLPVRRPTSRASREDDYLRLALLIMQRLVLRSRKMMMVVVMMVLVVMVTVSPCYMWRWLSQVGAAYYATRGAQEHEDDDGGGDDGVGGVGGDDDGGDGDGVR